MTAIIKRLLNVLTLLVTAYLLLIVAFAVTGGTSDWSKFFSMNGTILVICYGTIAAISYIAFGKAVLWHKNSSAKGP